MKLIKGESCTLSEQSLRIDAQEAVEYGTLRRRMLNKNEVNRK